MVHLVFGGTGGMGSALARRLRRRGASVHLIARDAVRLAALADEIGATWTAADVRDEAALTTAIEAAGDVLEGLAYAVGTIRL